MVDMDERQKLLAELISLRAWEHRYDDFDTLAERGREIMSALAEGGDHA